MGKESPVPPGAYVELDATLIDEGRFIAELNASIRRMFAELREYHKVTMSSAGSASVVAKIAVERSSGTEQMYDITHEVKVSAPTVKRKSMVKEAGDRLICQPTGSNGDPDQMLFYDGRGRIIGSVDKGTGEITQPEPVVAGKIEKKA